MSRPLQRLQSLRTGARPPEFQDAAAFSLFRNALPGSLHAPMLPVCECPVHPQHSRRGVGSPELWVLGIDQSRVLDKLCPPTFAEEQYSGKVPARSGVRHICTWPALHAVSDAHEAPECATDVVRRQQRRGNLAADRPDSVRVTTYVYQPGQPVPSRLGPATTPQGDEDGVEPALTETDGLSARQAELPAFHPLGAPVLVVPIRSSPQQPAHRRPTTPVADAGWRSPLQGRRLEIGQPRDECQCAIFRAVAVS
mmetsp:Transcript_92063/g.274756  ORF Transcript_92063/g.274756 Transcript_92063/m.274756 type:complete len:253 (+) Transcript_92063:454-1212(+)